ncbi:hypothetical protein AWB71_01875 [Caballeronia peredens]|nr:hypothetical protein AWB71_01875 [Caballeronia peredens]
MASVEVVCRKNREVRPIRMIQEPHMRLAQFGVLISVSQPRKSDSLNGGSVFRSWGSICHTGFQRILWAMLLLFSYQSLIFAQATNGAPRDGGQKPFSADSWLTSRESVIAASVLLFGLAMTLIASRMLAKSRVPVDDVIRLFALVIIVTGVLFLVAAGYSATDIAPSMGLLGTIAGYILGRTSRTNPQDGRPNTPTDTNATTPATTKTPPRNDEPNASETKK